RDQGDERLEQLSQEVKDFEDDLARNRDTRSRNGTRFASQNLEALRARMDALEKQDQLEEKQRQEAYLAGNVDLNEQQPIAREDSQELEAFIAGVVACKPWLAQSQQRLKRKRLSTLERVFDERALPGTGSCAAELDFISTTVEPFIRQPQPLKSDQLLREDARYFPLLNSARELIARFKQRSHYARLGLLPEGQKISAKVLEGVSEAAVRKAYHTQIRVWHPDKAMAQGRVLFAHHTQYLKVLDAVFTLVEEAYSTLRDNTKRAVYDAALVQSALRSSPDHASKGKAKRRKKATVRPYGFYAKPKPHQK
ncbi:hypothetical protein KIPB_008270, partial [Kipferlia bialata]